MCSDDSDTEWETYLRRRRARRRRHFAVFTAAAEVAFSTRNMRVDTSMCTNVAVRLDEFSDEYCKQLFRFRKEELVELMRAGGGLQLPATFKDATLRTPAKKRSQ